MKRRHRVPVLTLVSLSCALLVACGGGDDDPATAANAPAANTPPASTPPATTPPPASTPPPSTPPPSGSNSAPRITGTPSTTVLQGSTYSFVPSATDADGNALTFSIANAPAWATFNASTGRLSGTPTAAQVGTYPNITSSVSDGSASASLPAFGIQVVALATGSVTLSWTPPTQNTDGSVLNNLAGYKVYWGTSQSSYSNSVTVNNAGLSRYVVEQLTPATWYFAVTALNAAGSESGFSNVVTKTIQ
jgi:hypothetical protein